MHKGNIDRTVRKKNKFTITVREFNIPLMTGRIRRLKISKDIINLNNPINQLGLIYI